jgi:hypothetical protein
MTHSTETAKNPENRRWRFFARPARGNDEQTGCFQAVRFFWRTFQWIGACMSEAPMFNRHQGHLREEILSRLRRRVVVGVSLVKRCDILFDILLGGYANSHETLPIQSAQPVLP